MKLCELFNTLDELKIDNRHGAGAVPDNLNVDYLGLNVQMKPSIFLKLAAKLSMPTSADELTDYIKQGGAIGAPFLNIQLPDEWTDDVPNYDKPARIVGHEGRNRMIAAQRAEGDNPVEVHLFFRGGLRRRHLTPEIIELLQFNSNGILNQDGRFMLDSPLFKFDNTQPLNELFDNPYQTKWVKKTANNTDAVFSTSDGTKITVSFNNTDNMTTIGFEAEYYDKVADQTIITFLATGRGDAPRIFATIISAIKKFTTEKKPDYLFFTSLEPSRTKLYNTMVRMLGTSYSRLPASAINNMQTTDRVKGILANYAEELPPDEMFILEKKNKQQLNELFGAPYKFVEEKRDQYKFVTKSGNEYAVLCDKNSFWDPDLRTWLPATEVQFGLISDKRFQSSIQKTGDAVNVFATVLAIVKHHLDKMSASEYKNYISFTASHSEPSRVKLYDAFIRTVPKFLPDFKPYKTIDEYGERSYSFKNIHPKED